MGKVNFSFGAAIWSSLHAIHWHELLCWPRPGYWSYVAILRSAFRKFPGKDLLQKFVDLESAESFHLFSFWRKHCLELWKSPWNRVEKIIWISMNIVVNLLKIFKPSIVIIWNIKPSLRFDWRMKLFERRAYLFFKAKLVLQNKCFSS